jgi:hypothetical protein
LATLRADERGTARILAIFEAEGWRMAVVLKTTAFWDRDIPAESAVSRLRVPAV